jgi:hypothetical protein
MRRRFLGLSSRTASSDSSSGSVSGSDRDSSSDEGGQLAASHGSRRRTRAKERVPSTRRTRRTTAAAGASPPSALLLQTSAPPPFSPSSSSPYARPADLAARSARLHELGSLYERAALLEVELVHEDAAAPTSAAGAPAGAGLAAELALFSPLAGTSVEAAAAAARRTTATAPHLRASTSADAALALVEDAIERLRGEELQYMQPAAAAAQVASSSSRAAAAVRPAVPVRPLPSFRRTRSIFSPVSPSGGFPFSPPRASGVSAAAAAAPASSPGGAVNATLPSLSSSASASFLEGALDWREVVAGPPLQLRPEQPVPTGQAIGGANAGKDEDNEDDDDDEPPPPPPPPHLTDGRTIEEVIASLQRRLEAVARQIDSIPG